MSAPHFRAAYALPDDLHYLNGATKSPQLRNVTAAGIAAVREKGDPTNYVQDRWLQPVLRLREQFGRLIGSDGDHIATTPSVSYGMATIARNLTMVPGQKVVSVSEVFPSGYYTWQAFAKTHGGHVELVDCPAEITGFGESPMDVKGWNAAILDAIDERCAVASIPPIHWSNGATFNLPAIRAKCDDVGAALVVDATQWLGARPFDVTDCRPDALVCGGYKWLGGPYTLAYLYVDDKHFDGVPLEENWMNRAGSEDFTQLTNWTSEYRAGAARYCMGEQSHFINVAMASVALEQLQQWGVHQIQSATEEVMDPYWSDFEALPGKLLRASDRCAHLFGLQLSSDHDLPGLKHALRAANIAVSFRGDFLRVSPHVSSRASDVEALLAVLREQL